MIDHLRTIDVLCHWRQIWWDASNKTTFDLRTFRNSLCVLYWKNKLIWVGNDMRGSKLHFFFLSFLGELLFDCFYCSDNTICLAWMICSVGKGGNKKRWDKVSISCSDRTQAVFRHHWRQLRKTQESYNYTPEEASFVAALNTLATRHKLSSVHVVIFWWQIMLTGYINNKKLKGRIL